MAQHDDNQTEPLAAPVMNAAARKWWDALSQRERELWLKHHELQVLSGRLREAIDLATTYLDDGAPLSAQRVLKEAIK